MPSLLIVGRRRRLVSATINRCRTAHPDRAFSDAIRSLEHKARLCHVLVYWRYRSVIKDGIVAVDERYSRIFAIAFVPDTVGSPAPVR